MKKSLLKVSHKPAVTVTKNMTVLDAVRVMLQHKVGAAAVVDDGHLKGIFTERDVMARVVIDKRNPETTLVSEVMTTNVIPIDQNADPDEGLRIMVDRHIRHLPVVDGNGNVLAMLSMRHLMREEIDDLKSEVSGLTNYISSDGIGG